MDVVASEIRRLHRRVTQAERRLALALLPGKVASVDMATRTVRLELGRDTDGKPVLSPPVRWQATGAGTLKVHAAPKVGELMTLQSPSGTIGAGSVAAWGTFDGDNPAPSSDAAAAVLQVGGSTLTLKGDGVTVDAPKLTLKAAGTSLNMSSAGATFDASKLTFNAGPTQLTLTPSGASLVAASFDHPDH